MAYLECLLRISAGKHSPQCSYPALEHTDRLALHNRIAELTGISGYISNGPPFGGADANIEGVPVGTEQPLLRLAHGDIDAGKRHYRNLHSRQWLPRFPVPHCDRPAGVKSATVHWPPRRTGTPGRAWRTSRARRRGACTPPTGCWAPGDGPSRPRRGDARRCIRA